MGFSTTIKAWRPECYVPAGFQSSSRGRIDKAIGVAKSNIRRPVFATLLIRETSCPQSRHGAQCGDSITAVVVFSSIYPLRRMLPQLH